jgi:hypothetical protein
LLSKIAEHQFT